MLKMAKARFISCRRSVFVEIMGVLTVRPVDYKPCEIDQHSFLKETKGKDQSKIQAFLSRARW